MLAGCATSPASFPVETHLPDKPDKPFTKTVALPSIAAGMQPETILGQCLVKLDTANGRIVDSWRWYDFVRISGQAPG